MKIFACDSTAKTASVALCENNILLAEFTQNGGNTHSETLLPMTEVLLNSMKTDIDEIDAESDSIFSYFERMSSMPEVISLRIDSLNRFRQWVAQ